MTQLQQQFSPVETRFRIQCALQKSLTANVALCHFRPRQRLLPPGLLPLRSENKLLWRRGRQAAAGCNFDKAVATY